MVELKINTYCPFRLSLSVFEVTVQDARPDKVSRRGCFAPLTDENVKRRLCDRLGKLAGGWENILKSEKMVWIQTTTGRLWKEVGMGRSGSYERESYQSDYILNRHKVLLSWLYLKFSQSCDMAIMGVSSWKLWLIRFTPPLSLFHYSKSSSLSMNSYVRLLIDRSVCIYFFFL